MTSPRWARALLTRVVPEHAVDEVVGDLEEVHRVRVVRHGRWIAGWTTGLDALSVAATFAVRALFRGARQGLLTSSEVRLALRLLARTPFLSGTVLLALTVGVTLAATGFTVVGAILSPDLPFPEGSRVVEITVHDSRTGESVGLTPYLLGQWRERGGTLDRLGGLRWEDQNLRHENGEIEIVRVARVTPSGFDYAAHRPVLGRLLATSDARPGIVDEVAVIGQDFWERRFAADPDAVGRTIDIGGHPVRVVGVVSTRTTFPAAADILRPLMLPSAPPPVGGPVVDAAWGLLPVGSLPTVVEAELTSLAAADQSSSAGPPLSVRVRRVGEVDGAGGQGGLVVALLVGFLLVIAGNVGNLMVARAAARGPELTVRAAMGAPRSRIIAQLALEALVVSAISCVVGLVASQSLLAAFARSEADALPPWIDFRLGVLTAVFVAGVALLITLVAGVVPALRATRPGASDPRGLRPPSGAFGRIHDALIVLQVALSVGIMGTAVMVQRGWTDGYGARVLDLPAAEIVSAQVELPSPSTPAGAWALRTELEREVGTLSSVVGVASSSFLPGADAPLRVLTLESGREGGAQQMRPPVAAVGPQFFDVIGGVATAGRLLVETDHAAEAAPVAVVNEAFVERYLGGANAIGRRLRLDDGGAGESQAAWRTVVGVVADLGMSANDPDRAGGVFVPLTGQSAFRLLVRTSARPVDVMAGLRGSAYVVDPEISIGGVRVLADVIQTLRRVYLGIGTALTSLAGIVLLLSMMGIYAILSFEVTRRTREIGVRVALGAEVHDVVRPVLVRAMAYVGLGGLLGTALGMVLVAGARAMFVMRFPATGPATFSLLVAGTLVAAVAAAAVPTRRALAIEPADALRAE